MEELQMRKVEAPKEFLDFMEEKDFSLYRRYSAMGDLSTLFFGTANRDLENFLVQNEEDIIDFLKGEVEFIPEKQELFYIHLANGENGYVNIDKENGELALENKKDTTYWKTEFTKEEVIQINPSYVHFLEPVENVEDEKLDVKMPTDLGEKPAKFFVFKKDSLDACDFYNEYTSGDGHKRYCWDNANEVDEYPGKYKTKFTLEEIKQFNLEFDKILLIPTVIDGEDVICPFDMLEEKFHINNNKYGVGICLNLEEYSSTYLWNTCTQTNQYKTEFSTEDLINIEPRFLNGVKFELVS